VDGTYAAREIAEIMGKSKRGIMKRAEKETWPYNIENGKGGDHRRYPLATLPPDVQIALYNNDTNPALLPHLSAAALATVLDQGGTLYNKDASPATFADAVSGPAGKSRRRKSQGPPSPQAPGAIPDSSAALPIRCVETHPTYNNDANPPCPPLLKGETRSDLLKGGMVEGLPKGEVAGAMVPAGRPDFYAPARTYEFEKFPEWSPERAISADALKNHRVANILAILREAEAVPRDWQKGNDAWISFVATKNGVARQSIYRWLQKYDKRGIAGIEHRKSSRGEPKAWTKEALDWWIGLALKPEHRKIDLQSLYYDALIIEANRRAWKIGGLASARWWFGKKATPALLALQKGGMRALDNILPPVLRDYSDLAPFEMLVGDQHRWDFWVVDDDTGVVFRPEVYLWQDLRTRIIYGAAFDRRYDAYLCGEALRIGMRIWGCFNAIYTDNGSSELSKYIMGIMSEIRAMGMEWRLTDDVPLDILDVDGEEINPVVTPIAPGTHKKAVVKNAKAKLIESTNAVMEGILRGHFRAPGNVKRLTDDINTQDVDHQEAMKLAAEGKLLLASEFYFTVYKAIDYYNREKAHRGVRREWLWKPVPASVTPMDCLKACYGEGWRPRYISNEAADMVFLRRVDRTVRLGRVELDREFYEHDALLEMHGERVTLRYNKIETDLALVYRGAEFVCAAHPIEYSSMKDGELARRKIMEKRAKRKAVAERFREITQPAPDLREYSQAPETERVAAVVGQEKKRIEAMQANMTRALSPEELAAEVAKLEALNERLPDGQTRAMAMAQIGKPAPVRPSNFASKATRYEWCIQKEASGGELSAEDRFFVEEEEVKMTTAERERWQFEREYGATYRNGGF